MALLAVRQVFTTGEGEMTHRCATAVEHEDERRSLTSVGSDTRLRLHEYDRRLQTKDRALSELTIISTIAEENGYPVPPFESELSVEEHPELMVMAITAFKAVEDVKNPELRNYIISIMAATTADGISELTKDEVVALARKLHKDDPL